MALFGSKTNSFLMEQMPFQKGIPLQESKQKVIKVVFLVKMMKTLPSVSSSLNFLIRSFHIVVYHTYPYYLCSFGSSLIWVCTVVLSIASFKKHHKVVRFYHKYGMVLVKVSKY